MSVEQTIYLKINPRANLDRAHQLISELDPNDIPNNSIATKDLPEEKANPEYYKKPASAQEGKYIAVTVSGKDEAFVLSLIQEILNLDIPLFDKGLMKRNPLVISHQIIDSLASN